MLVAPSATKSILILTIHARGGVRLSECGYKAGNDLLICWLQLSKVLDAATINGRISLKPGCLESQIKPLSDEVSGIDRSNA